jgi:site-specific DNA-methyltransferase (adenine-specific)
MLDLRLGRYQDVLADVRCDAVIADPPYGERTHSGQRHGRRDVRYQDCYSPDVATRGIGYAHWTPDDVAEFVAFWAPRCTGWFACFTSHDLTRAYMQAYEAAGLYAFAPVVCLMPGMNVRLAGDGPSSWAVYLMVARPRTMRAWGTLPGGYYGSPGEDRKSHPVVGGKPLWLMQSVVRDYSRPGDLICDPCAGGGTTLLAAAQTGRRAIGAELDPVTHAKALKRLANTPVTTDWLDTVPKGEQGGLW